MLKKCDETQLRGKQYIAYLPVISLPLSPKIYSKGKYYYYSITFRKNYSIYCVFQNKH